MYNKLKVAALLSIGLTTTAHADVISLSDDSSEQVGIGFDFSFFGETYDNVYIGSNGYLTFDGGDSDYTESVSELLNNKARISVWDDFNPAASNAASITTSSTDDSFTVSWDLIPQWGNSDSNSFDITLFNNGSIDIYFESIDTNDLLVGISAGSDTTGTAVDFSTSSVWSANQTSYELFTNNFDLDGETISFQVPEPSSMAILGLGLLGLTRFRRKA